jgi:two-component system sensor histidine kinase KdpD
VHIDPALSLVQCDAALIERVLVNLLENAGKFTPDTSPVDLSARAAGDDVLLSVSDQGPGVVAGQEDLIFEKFTRGHAESATPGVGLGLAICRAIVQAHHGHIWVTPNQPRGASFSFSLPLGSPPDVDMSDDVASVTTNPQP